MVNRKIDLDVIEEPGSVVQCYQCAYCGMAYRFQIPNASGGFTPARDQSDNEVAVPDTCRRCGAPMDYGAVHDRDGFADKMAEATINTVPTREKRNRNRMVDQAPSSKA